MDNCWFPQSFHRLPGWRWARACWLHETGRSSSSSLEDVWVAGAVQFLAAEGQCQIKKRSTKVDRHAVGGAVQLSHEESPSRRWQVEAELLTDLSLDEIARRHSLPVEVVEGYHQLFFDVRPYLAATDWIMAQAVGTTWWHGFAARPLGTLWRFFAFTEGTRALELMVALTTDAPWPAWLRKEIAGRPVYEQKRLRVLGKQLVAALTTDSGGQWQALVAARDQVRRLDRQALGTRHEGTTLEPVMKRFLKSFGARGRRGRHAAEDRPHAKPRASRRISTRKAQPAETIASLVKCLK